MLEEIVLLKTKIANPQKQVFKLQFSPGKFDMVIADKKTSTKAVLKILHRITKVFLSTTDITAGLFKLKVSTKRRKPFSDLRRFELQL